MKRALFSVRNPATLEVVSSAVPDCSVQDVNDALMAAEEGFSAWSRETGRAKSRAIRAWHDRIVEEREELARLMVSESGKPLKEARGEMDYACSFLEWFSEEAPRVRGRVDDGVARDRRFVTLRQPAGVAALITPWNFPAAMITRKCGAALAAGCSIVCKPAEDTPLTALALSRLSEGLFPDGVLNMVTTTRPIEVGEALCSSDKVRAVSFTGSTRVGQWLYEKSAGTMKTLGLELGGNAPFVVLEGADVDLAVKCALASKFRNAGQTCVCPDRFIVHESHYDEFVDGLHERMESLRMGNAMADDDVDLGPLINEAAKTRVAALVEQAAKCSIRQTHTDYARHGPNFYPPTIVEIPSSNACSQTQCWTEETFGPIVAVTSYSGSDEDALRFANDDSSGLAGYVVCRDLRRGWRFAEKLQVGMVGVNESIISHAQASFGGIKLSGVGREGADRGIDEFLQDKYICLGSLDF